jgi:transcriptional repressor NrdR
MFCPFCSAPDTKVIDSRLTEDGVQVRRRRECVSCLERFSTVEAPALVLPNIIKKDGRRSAFSSDKLRQGIMKALEKRPVTAAQVDVIMRHLNSRLQACGEREVASSVLGQWVMDELKAVDKVAYVRFASVYLSFQDIEAFDQEIQRLKEALENNR